MTGFLVGLLVGVGISVVVGALYLTRGRDAGG